MKWLLAFLLACSTAVARPAPVIYVTNYVFTTNYVYGVITNYVNTTNFVSWTNTVNTYTYVTTTNWITNTVVMPQVLTNLHVFGSFTVEGTNGSVQTFTGSNLTGHLP